MNVQIRAYVDEAQPGWVECSLVDAHGREWRFVEKAPVVAAAVLDRAVKYPQPGVIACVVVSESTDAAGRAVADIDTSYPWGIESVEGNTRFRVFMEQITTVAVAL